MPQENIKDYAIVIGINDYFALNPLKGAIHDAMEMEKWLVAADGGNLPASNCKHIFSEHNPLFPDNGGDIDDKLEEIYNEAIKSGGK